MEKLVVDEEGKITIPAHVPSRRGLRPGDELLLVEAAEGLLLYRRGADPLTARWWADFIDEGRRQAQAETHRYANMGTEDWDHKWGGEAVT